MGLMMGADSGTGSARGTVRASRRSRKRAHESGTSQSRTAHAANVKAALPVGVTRANDGEGGSGGKAREGEHDISVDSSRDKCE
jgi:hypothetical protein